MKYRRTRRLRIISGASLLLFLAGLPLALGLTRPSPDAAAEPPGVVLIYAHGLSSLGWAGLVAAILAVVAGIWLVLGQRQEVHRRYLGANARRRHNFTELARTVAIIGGAAGLIIGSLSGLYAAMMQARPDLYYSLPLPFFTAQLALTCLLGGGALYAAGRIGR
jgi:hypothetical protein